MTDIWIVALGVGLLVIGAGALAAAFYLLGRIHAGLMGLEARVSQLEQLRPKDHTHRTKAGLEDAMAIAMDLLRDMDADKARLDMLWKTLQAVRSGPHAYDPDKPAGVRPRDE